MWSFRTTSNTHWFTRAICPPSSASKLNLFICSRTSNLSFYHGKYIFFFCVKARKDSVTIDIQPVEEDIGRHGRRCVNSATNITKLLSLMFYASFFNERINKEVIKIVEWPGSYIILWVWAWRWTCWSKPVMIQISTLLKGRGGTLSTLSLFGKVKLLYFNSSDKVKYFYFTWKIKAEKVRYFYLSMKTMTF